MTPADTIALTATICTAVVGVAGVASNVILAMIRRDQDIALAGKQHSHERELARGDRLYERRAPVYEQLMGIVVTVMEHVEARQSMMEIGRPLDLPAEPSLDDQRAVQVRLRSHGSVEVGDAFQEWFQKVRDFQWYASTYESLREGGGEIGNVGAEMQATREQARAAADKLARLVSEELASL
jgi:hypothetical protein